MLLSSITGASRKELEKTCDTLGADLVKKKLELTQKEIQIQRLSKNNRKWVRKYNELEMSMSENMIECLDDDHESKICDADHKQLQLLLIKLNKRNKQLEKRVEKLNLLLEKQSSQTNSTDAVIASSGSASKTSELELPEKFKKVLDHYAETTPDR